MRPSVQTSPKKSPIKVSTCLVDLSIIRNNIAYLQTFGCSLAPAVKANAYGVGAIPVVKTLHDHGIQEFFVAYFEEGVALRESVPGYYIIYVLNDVKNYSLEDFKYYKLTPVLYDLDSIEYWKNIGEGYPCAVHFDTGMHRTGAPIDASIHGLNAVLVMSHLCAAEDKNSFMNKQQLSLFQTIKPTMRKSLANSGGIFLGKEYHFDLARPGIACYGFDNFGHSKIQNCVTIWSHVLQIDYVKDGFVGYNMQYPIERPTIVATLGIGYADGAPRELEYVCFGSYKAPVIGLVSMDLITVDVTYIPESLWHEPVLISDNWPGFAYQYALRLGTRIKRVYNE